jgi:1-acyl-sn-glycerol-3-phosphate acyltransferase
MTKLIYTETRSLTGWRKTHDVFRFYWWWWINRIYMRVWFRLSVKGEENIPTSGPAILASNHLSFLDANIISAASPRKVSFMIAREWYEHWMIRWMAEFLGCIPVNRSGQDLGAIKTALKHLSKEYLLGCFPEGGISQTGEMQDGKLGVALLAVKSGCPVVPVCLSGYGFQSLKGTFLIPKRIRITIGKPLVFEGVDSKNRENLERVTSELTQAIRELEGSAD